MRLSSPRVEGASSMQSPASHCANRPPPSSPRQQDRDGDVGRAGDRRDRAQHRQRSAEKERGLRVDGDERGAVHVAPVEVPREIEKVEFVGK